MPSRPMPQSEGNDQPLGQHVLGMARVILSAEAAVRRIGSSDGEQEGFELRGPTSPCLLISVDWRASKVHADDQGILTSKEIAARERTK
jgi:hypothetical protein